MSKKKYNWEEIQKFYNDNHTWRDICEEFGCASGTINAAIKRGDLTIRSKSESQRLYLKLNGSRKHSEETKNKISKKRIEFLTENPDKVPYIINHSSKPSYPEQVFENALKESKITGWVYRFRNGIYEYDFAFPDKKIDVEIDGNTHKSEKVKKIDKRRDLFSKNNGWTVIRFEADKVKKNVIGCINELKKILDNL